MNPHEARRNAAAFTAIKGPIGDTFRALLGELDAAEDALIGIGEAALELADMARGDLPPETLAKAEKLRAMIPAFKAVVAAERAAR